MFGKEQLQALVRPLVVKWVTRGVLWVMTTWLALGSSSAAESQETASAIGQAAGAIACLVLSLLVDRWHHKRDTAAASNSSP